MLVTRVEPVTKSRSRVYVDEQLAFILYKGELSRYKIKENTEITREVYDEIIREVLVKRSRLRCMNLLKSMDRTEHQLCEKLRHGGYPEEVIRQAIEYVKSYGYVDDKRYASSYLRCYQGRKSLRQMQQELMQKGISREDINEALAEQEFHDEKELIHRWIEKKRVDLDKASRAEIQKLYMFLMRKGFSSSDISKVLRGTEDFQ